MEKTKVLCTHVFYCTHYLYERERERETETETETDRDRQTDRQRELELENFILQGLYFRFIQKPV